MSTKIRVFAEYQEYNLTSISRVEKLINKITFNDDSEIELDLRECLIDYYATSKLVDKAFETLKDVNGKKKIKVVTDFQMGEAPLVNALLLGSVIFNLVEDHELNIDTIRSKITPILLDSKMCLEISIVDISGNDLDRTMHFGECDI